MRQSHDCRQESPTVSLQTAPGLVDDLEALLATLRHKAEEAAAAGVHVGEHPSVSFYRGTRPVEVRLPPRQAGEVRQDKSCLQVIALHQALLPPCRNGACATEEEHSARLSSSDGLELLRLNWNRLLWLLLPSLRFGGTTERCAAADAGDASMGANGECAANSAISDWELYRPVAWEDYRQLRHPSIMDRVHYSYVVFLRFYGWRLYDEESGVLDRHQNWRGRYKALEPGGHLHEGGDAAGGSCIGFYAALPRILCVLLELCLTRYAVNLVAFLLEEMSKGRLLLLQSSLEESWLPLILRSKQVVDAEKARLRRQLYRLSHSDSD
ncbi:uncharacterized protein Tco025E_05744 [Trypanosoma conorhini]|uniref:Opioid growth factor receptor (OGFr) conserved domain-containing protein n=1 Tax=Trypanosoma conorhini TaxID=83891 RepID=A0A3R7N2G5_9TRYP|nr:uncharacterized protein Tco025E_05744 [Trypanosoma conorhini]RNF14952.1 hypothetical protein Tco025E_05744 [Trypanosoma conorhini]